MATTSIHPIRVTQAKSLQYITNPEKVSYVRKYGCNGSAEEISDQFDVIRSFGKNKGSVLGYHIIQSFAPNESTAEQVHQAGLMLCEKLFQGQYAYVLATHTDTDHIHNHIIFCKTNMENYKAFGTLMDTKRNPAWKKIRYELDCIIQCSDTFEDFLEKCRLNSLYPDGKFPSETSLDRQ